MHSVILILCLGIVVITDGVLSFPNCKSLDALLSQLRNSTIACSFIQLGSPYHPFSSFGRVPYKELMEFISTATCGAYFPASRDIVCIALKREFFIFFLIPYRYSEITLRVNKNFKF